MAAQYTEVTLDDIDKFLKRGFRALRPKQGVQRSEYFYDLTLNEYMMIRVWSSVQRGADTGAGVGEDAIRVQLLSIQTQRPLLPGKAPIVKRTQGWRNTLQNKIEDAMEAAEEKMAAGDARSQQPSNPTPPPAPVEDDEPEQREREEEEDHGPPLRGTWTQYRGDWCARIPGNGRPGATAIIEAKGGRRAPVILVQKLWGGRSNYGNAEYAEIWSVRKKERTASEEPAPPEEVYSYDRR